MRQVRQDGFRWGQLTRPAGVVSCSPFFMPLDDGKDQAIAGSLRGDFAAKAGQAAGGHGLA